MSFRITQLQYDAVSLSLTDRWATSLLNTLKYFSSFKETNKYFILIYIHLFSLFQVTILLFGRQYTDHTWTIIRLLIYKVRRQTCYNDLKKVSKVVDATISLKTELWDFKIWKEQLFLIPHKKSVIYLLLG